MPVNQYSSLYLLQTFFKKYKAVILSVLAILLVFIVFLLIQDRLSHKEREFKAVNIPAIGLGNMYSRPDSVRFFNGRNFIDYGLKNSQTSKIMEDQEYPNIKNLTWSNNGESVVFESEAHRGSDILSKKLEAKGRRLAGSYWWIADLKSKKISFLASNVEKTNPVWGKDNVLYFRDFPSDIDPAGLEPRNHVNLYKFETSSGKLIKSMQLPSSIAELKYVIDNKVFYTEKNSQKSTTLFVKGQDNDARKIITSETEDIDIGDDGRFSYFYKEADTDNKADEKGYSSSGDINDHSQAVGDIVIIDNTNGQEAVVVEGVDDNALFTLDKVNSLWALTQNDKGEIKLVQREVNGKTTDFSIKNSVLSLLDMTKISVSSGTIIVDTSRGFGVIGLDDVKEVNYPMAISNFKNSSKEKPYVIIQSTRDLSVNVNIFSKPVNTYKDKALDEISKSDVDTNLLWINFDSSSTEDPTRD